MAFLTGLISCFSILCSKGIFVLYGSQTGNAEFIATEVAGKIGGLGLNTTCLPLNKAKGIDLKDQAAFVLVGKTPINFQDLVSIMINIVELFWCFSVLYYWQRRCA
jgi:flavodoxin